MGNIIGIVCCPMIAKNILKQMSMPQDTFIVSSETTLLHRTITPYEHMATWAKELSSKLAPDDLRGLIETVGLEDKIDLPVSQMSLVEQKKLLFLKAMLSCSHNLILHNFFDNLTVSEANTIQPLLVEVSTYATIFLIGTQDTGFDFCDWIIRL